MVKLSVPYKTILQEIYLSECDYEKYKQFEIYVAPDGNGKTIIKVKKGNRSYDLKKLLYPRGKQDYLFYKDKNKYNISRENVIIKTFQGSYKNVSQRYWTNLIYNAQRRGIDFNLSIEDASDLLDRQQHKCALSGIWIIMDFPYVGAKDKAAASLDRIDSTKGYFIDNVQWVAQDINFMKQSLSQETFIDFCEKITTNHARN